MRNLIFALAAATAMTSAVPLAAQSGPYNQGTYNQGTYNQGGYNQGAYHRGANIEARIAQLDARFQAGIANGMIDRNEARSLRQQIRQINRLYGRYNANGLTQQERRDLQQRIRYTRQQLRAADGDRRYAGWNDESYYGNWDDDRFGGYGNLHQVNEVCAQTRTGVSAILGRLLGNDNCLRVGERVTTSLSPVPAEMRGQVPTRSGYRYGYVEGTVVEVDNRTGVVTRIYHMG